MIKSALFKKSASLCVAGGLSTVLFGFCYQNIDDETLIIWSNRCLTHWFDPDSGLKLKKWNLTLTDDYFLRLHKYYQTGKQEYFSFHLHRLKDLDYLGTADNGILRLSTGADDIIVQTYNDPKGDIDSMATTVDVPVHNVEPEQLDSLRLALLQLRNRH